MKAVRIIDSTIENANLVGKKLSFKDKLDAVKLLDELKVDAVRLGVIGSEKENLVLVRTLAATVKYSVLCCGVGLDGSGIAEAADALKGSAARLVVDLPCSPALLEYKLGKKPKIALEMLSKVLSSIAEAGFAAEVRLIDATSAERSFIESAVSVAKENGVKEFTVSESASGILPEELAAFVVDMRSVVGDATLNVSVRNSLGLSLALTSAAVFAGADGAEVAVGAGEFAALDAVISLLSSVGAKKCVSTGVVATAVNRITDELKEVIGEKVGETTLKIGLVDEKVLLPQTTEEELFGVISTLGYELNYEDRGGVYDSFLRIMAKKGKVSVRELDAIIAASSMQAPSVYSLVDYIINTGNTIRTTASVTMERRGEKLFGLSSGDGAIDAAFHAIESITGARYELDDFKVESLTEGKDAVGRTIVKLRHNGVVYVGAGVSTDIVGASIRAYVNALNKIAFAEAGGENR